MRYFYVLALSTAGCTSQVDKPTEIRSVGPVDAVPTSVSEECSPEALVPTQEPSPCIESPVSYSCPRRCPSTDGTSIYGVFLPGYDVAVDFPSWPVEGQDTANPNLTHVCVAAETLDQGCQRLLGTAECPRADSDLLDDSTWGADGAGWTHLGEIPAPDGQPLYMSFATLVVDDEYVWLYFDGDGELVLINAYSGGGWCCNGDGGSRYAFWGDLPEFGMCDPA